MTVLARLFPWRTPGAFARSLRASPAVTPIPPRSADPRVEPAAANDADPVATGRALAERRGAALRGMFPLLFSMCARRSDLWQAVAIERYLAQASNLAELEQRIRQIEQRRTFSWSE